MIEARHSQQVLDDFYEYLSLVLSHFKSLIPLLENELQHILTGSIKQLESNLMKQQVYLMRTRSFDLQVKEYASRMNINASTLTELTLQLDSSQQIRFFALLAEFDTVLRQVGFYRDKCCMLLQDKLHHLSHLLSVQGDIRENTTYDKNAWEVPGRPVNKLYEKKI